MSFEEFQDGRYLGYRNGTILAILYLLCHYDASHQVSAQSDLWFGRRRCLKNFKMAAILDNGTEQDFCPPVKDPVYFLCSTEKKLTSDRKSRKSDIIQVTA